MTPVSTPLASVASRCRSARCATTAVSWLATTVALVLAAGLFAPAAAQGDPPGRVGRLADFGGAVWQLDVETNEWAEATRNQPVVGGDRLLTDRDARAVVQIGSATLRLAGATEVEWLRVDDDEVQVRVHRGSVGLRVRSAEVAREFELVTSQGGYRPRFAGHYRVDQLDGASAGHALVGEMTFETADSRRRIDAGQRFEFWQRGDPPVTFHDSVVSTHDDFGLWLLAEERRERREAVSTRYVSPEMTGWQDLDRHGRWDRHPEFGFVWMPWSVTPGWAPYRFGRWVWVRPWGWTWVDGMPWGFAPFHYGRWVWWSGGWAWAPGPWVARPVYAPALVGWIGGTNVNIGISIGSPWVGWVPLSPRDVYRPWYPVTPRHPHFVPPSPPGWRPPARPFASTGYGHLDAPGAVTAVSPDVLARRQPIGERDLRRVDAGDVRRIAGQPGVGTPPARPPAPGRATPTPGSAAPTERVPRPAIRETPVPPAAPAAPAVRRAPAAPDARPGRDARETIPRLETRPVPGRVDAAPASGPAAGSVAPAAPLAPDRRHARSPADPASVRAAPPSADVASRAAPPRTPAGRPANGPVSTPPPPVPVPVSPAMAVAPVERGGTTVAADPQRRPGPPPDAWRPAPAATPAVPAAVPSPSGAAVRDEPSMPGAGPRARPDRERTPPPGDPRRRQMAP